MLAAVLALAPATAGAEVQFGVVLLHGKQSAPEEHEPLANAIGNAGHLVERPEMCWSGRRIYDQPYLTCLREIDAAFQRLQRRGATALVVAGHSLGANGALAYGARHQVAGVIALAPGHQPELLARRSIIIAALDRACALMAEGRARLSLSFPDFNGDFVVSVTATAETYLSFFALIPRVHAGECIAAERTLAVRRWQRRPAATRAGGSFREGAAASAQSLPDSASKPF